MAPFCLVFLLCRLYGRDTSAVWLAQPELNKLGLTRPGDTGAGLASRVCSEYALFGREQDRLGDAAPSGWRVPTTAYQLVYMMLWSARQPNRVADEVERIRAYVYVSHAGHRIVTSKTQMQSISSTHRRTCSWRVCLASARLHRGNQ